MMLILGGTSDSIQLAEELYGLEQTVIYSAATDFGDITASKRFKGKRIYGRKSLDELEKTIIENNIKIIVDATHPFAVNISHNAISVCASLGLEYIRYERPTKQLSDDRIIYFDNYDATGEYADNLKDGKIFITTGTNDIEKLIDRITDKNRIIARVLPISESIITLEGLGLNAENIIAMKGPFSEEMNYTMFKETGSEILISKDSGDQGGYQEKVRAAKRLNMKILVIRRPNIIYPNKFDSIEDVHKYVINILKA